MQFFPAAVSSAVSSAASSAANTVANTAADLLGAQGQAFSSDTQHASFDSILNSFIEEGRGNYAGRPAGFAGFEKQTGTLDELQGSQIIESLRKRQVDEESINGIEQLLASGAPLTMGRLFSLVSGNSRKTPALEDGERDAFAMLLGKLGFDKTETDEMLGLSDDGSTAALWKKLTNKLGKLDGTADVTKAEFSSLLKGLDVSEKTQKTLLTLFGQSDEQSLGGAHLEALLGHVSREYAKREKDAAHARGQIRAAVDEALKAAKAGEQSKPVEDMRGNRRSEQSETVMRDSVLKRTGAADIKHEQTGSRAQTDQGQDEASSFMRRDGRSALEHTGLEADGKGRAAKSEEKAGDPVSRLLHRIDMAGAQSRTNEASGQAQNLNSLARNFRQEIFSQVENGILQNAQGGARQLTLQLNPGELGQLTVLLSVRQGEVSATIRTENQDTSSVIREQLVELRASLEAQGLKVKELEVQTQLRDNSFANQWNGHQEHNLMRDSSERDRLIRLSRMQRGAGSGGGETKSPEVRQYATETTGLHIVA